GRRSPPRAVDRRWGRSARLEMPRRGRGRSPGSTRTPAPRGGAPPRRSRARPPQRRASRALSTPPSGRLASPSRDRAGSGRRAKRAPPASARADPRRARSPSARPREAEHAFGDDVAEHFRRPGLDRVAAAAELLVVPPAVVEDALRATQLARELREPLVRLRPAQLDARPFGAGSAGALVGTE